jgi:hypothetical protein
MPEQHDPFDIALRDRIGAAESRVPVSSAPPDGLPAGPGPARWLRPALVLATAVAAVVMAAAVINDLPGPSTADATPVPSIGQQMPSIEPTSIPTPPDQPSGPLQWNLLPGPDGTCCGSLSAVDGRVYLTGSSATGPVLWYSDDIGRTWTTARIDVPTVWEDDAFVPAIGQIAGTAERLIAAGVRHPTRGTVQGVVWASDDRGATWSAVTEGPFPAPGASLAWTGDRYVAALDNVGNRGRWLSEDPALEVWTSVDGRTWQAVPLPEDLSERVAVSRVVGFDGRAAVLVAEPSVASSSLGAPGKPAAHDRAGEIWVLDAAGTWSRASIGGDQIEAVGIGVGPYGFVAIASGSVDDTTRELLRSSDGNQWTGHRIEIAPNPPDSPHGPLAWAGWLSVMEGEGGIVFTASRGDWRTWHLAHGDATARAAPSLTADLAAGGEGFVGIWECGDFAYCGGPQAAIVAGLPVAELQPESLTGRLTSCFQDEGGYTWELQWPDGYSVEPDPGGVANLIGPDGQVVGRFGDELRDLGSDLITVRGHRVDDGEPGGCVSGPTLRFVVTEIVEVEPG